MDAISVVPVNGANVTIDPAVVLDPTIDFKTKQSYLITKGGTLNTYRPITSNTFSDSNVQFQVDIPSPDIVFDRRIKVAFPLDITFTGNTGNPAIPLLNYGFLDAFRAFPLSSIIQSLNVTWNSSTVSQNINDTNNALQWYQSEQHLETEDYSTFPAFQDQFQEYTSGLNTNRNPLGAYNNTSGPHNTTRGDFSIHIVSNTSTSANIIAWITEPIFMSPIAFGKDECPGFYGVTRFNFTFNLDPNLSRVWSHAQLAPYVLNTTTGITVTLRNVSSPYPQQNLPLLFLRYITLPPHWVPPEVNLHPFFDVQRYITETGGALVGGASTTIDTNSISLKQIPTTIYVYARRRNADQTFATTDTFAEALNLQVNWNNSNALLGSATQQDLYQMCVDNNCKMTYNQWIGRAGTSDNANGNLIATVGSVIALRMGKDVALNEDEAPGKIGQYQLQLRYSFRNPGTASVQYSVYVVVVSEGIFGISGDTAFQKVGIVDSSVVMDTAKLPRVSRPLVKNFYGGNFFTGIKKFFSEQLPNAIKSAVPYVKKAYQVGRAVAPLMGLGYGAPQTIQNPPTHTPQVIQRASKKRKRTNFEGFGKSNMYSVLEEAEGGCDTCGGAGCGDCQKNPIEFNVEEIVKNAEPFDFARMDAEEAEEVNLSDPGGIDIPFRQPTNPMYSGGNKISRRELQQRMNM